MHSIATATVSQPLRELSDGEVLIAEGSQSGKLFLLVSGALSVERDGVLLARIGTPGSFVGEMAVLLGTRHSATVRASGRTTVRVIEDALDFLRRNPELALHVATVACARLNETSALLVELRRGAEGRSAEVGLLARIGQALAGTPRAKPVPGVKSGWAAHE